LDGLIISAELTCQIANPFSLDHVICSQDNPIFNRPQEYFDWKKSKLLPSQIPKQFLLGCMTKTVDVDEHKCHFVLFFIQKNVLFCSFVDGFKKYACEAILTCMVPQVVAWLMLMNA
jgi:hypothetical protein